jgi:hypothetical protein
VTRNSQKAVPEDNRDRGDADTRRLQPGPGAPKASASALKALSTTRAADQRISAEAAMRKIQKTDPEQKTV